MTIKKIKSIVIVGGGTSGWMTAAALSKHFKNKAINITLIDSSQLGTIGVGEATIPTLRRFYQGLGFSDLDVINATNATCKLGIEFKDWHKKGSSFIHPFGLYGQGTKEVPFHHYWLKARQQGDCTDIADYSLGVNLAKHNKFTFPDSKPSSQLEIFDWALHFDASLFAQLMRDYAISNGVRHIDNKITNVNLSAVDGSINSLTLADNSQLDGDLFIDCSGFKGLLIQQTLKTGYIDWSKWLVCDRAVAVQSKASATPIPRTISHAQKAGWLWHIPLQHRTGNGHVYSSKFISDEEAKATLMQSLDDEALHEPRFFSFTPGRSKAAWNKNCIAVGLSSGFIEPLESTSIALVETAIDKIILSFSENQYSQREVDRFNEVTALEYERVRDFIILHYKANQRGDSPMWQYCQEMELPEMLKEKMRLFKEEAKIIRYPWEIFGLDSWLAIFSGLDYLPEVYDKKVDNMKLDYLTDNLNYMRSRVSKSVDMAPSHNDFLQQYCHFNPQK
ncbi:tryptophan 7-halogenase [Colwellia asteriadis]|uniref:Tryptophan 7-halogenase n=1 Tax=Colwellia asteriadis TaxID=517723 RepID=A0ABN1LAD4_9GAMM